jgi:hypothetical protein
VNDGIKWIMKLMMKIDDDDCGQDNDDGCGQYDEEAE